MAKLLIVKDATAEKIHKEVKKFNRKIQLTSKEASMNPNSKELAKVVMSRIGLEPRKTGSTDKMYRLLLEFYERAKIAHRTKRAEQAVMTVEEMGYHAGITRQTMYDYLKRWLALNVVTKTSYIVDNRVIIGYKLNGTTLENAFEKAFVQVQQNMQLTMKYVSELQRLVKNEKIAEAQKQNNAAEALEEDSELLVEA